MQQVQQVEILTYDSIPTDLASEMRGWREFVSGEAYVVNLREPGNGDRVSVWKSENWDDIPTVIVKGPFRSGLFDRTLGRVVQALSEHSDNLMVARRKLAEQGAPPNGGPARRSEDSTPRRGHHR